MVKKEQVIVRIKPRILTDWEKVSSTRACKCSESNCTPRSFKTRTRHYSCHHFKQKYWQIITYQTDNNISNIKEQILLPISVSIIVTDYAFILFHSRGRKLPSEHSIVYYSMVLFRKSSSRLQFSHFSKV